MKDPIPYQSAATRIGYETDADGGLHITIPPRRLGFFGMIPVWWGSSLAAPPAMVLVAFCIYRDVAVVLMAAVAGSAVSVMMLWLGWMGAYKLKFKTWIDATSEQLTVHQQRGASRSTRSFSRASLQAIDVKRGVDEDEFDAWNLEVHGRYEWEIIVESHARLELEEIAHRLRTLLQLPKRPAPPGAQKNLI